ncbi:MAG: IS5 family transposase [Bacteroidales bacterium]|nr:IS5 family transposase [Bacteroidales bacterium]
MYLEPTKDRQKGLFFSLEDTLNSKHPLYVLANKIDWGLFELEFKKLYCENNGRPCKPIRLMCGLLILKHLRNVSDESIVEQWSENAYYQYFCGLNDFSIEPACTPTELVHFRNRIGEEGIALILKESIRINQDDINKHNKRPAFIDSTVQEKNITYPTDTKLHKKIIKKCLKIVLDLSLPLRQSYSQTLKKLYRDQRFRNHPKNKKKALKADKKIKTIAGRLLRELERNLPSDNKFKQLFELFHKILSQTKTSKNKIYSIHEPEVECISKGKEHKKYEFGNKVSIIRSWNGVIIGAKSFRNEYDGHTIDESLKQVFELTGLHLNELAGDRGYRGQKQSGETKILIPDSPKKKDSLYQKRKKHKLFCKRAGIEPTIGHLKNDYRLNRNFYKGVTGDAVNLMLAAAAYNFKRAMNALLFVKILILKCMINIKNTFDCNLFYHALCY